MTDRQLLDLLGEMSDRHVLSPDQAPKVRKRRPVRTALIAACVCAAVVGTAFAAEALWGVFSGGRITDALCSSDGYQLLLQGIREFPHEDVGQDMKDDVNAQAAYAMEQAQAHPDGEFVYTWQSLLYDSWEALEQGVGIPLAQNSLLQQLWSSRQEGATFMARPEGGENGVTTIQVTANWASGEDFAITVVAYLKTDLASDDTLTDFRTYWHGGGIDLDSRNFTMPDGGNAIIMTATEDDVAWYVGDFVLNGIFYEVTVISFSGPSQEYEALLTDVLSQFAA